MDKYVVIGNPIKQSKSPFIHQAFALQTKQQMDYEKVLVPTDSFVSYIRHFQELGGKGCNVTLPFKEEAFQIADSLSERAKAAGAVNILIFNTDGTILGDNTDGQGLVGDILAQGVVIKGARVLLIGAGGAARGCILPLQHQQPKEIVIVNRTQNKAQALAQEFNSVGNIISSDMSSIDGKFDIVINSTSASLSGELPAISEHVIASANCCYDMAYGNEDTSFLVWAKKLGVPKTIDGLGMLVGQAAESFRLWRGVTPATELVLKQLRNGLN